jgi:retron-type reverse transcriptase
MIDRSIKHGYVHVFDADLKGYLENIPHNKLLEKIARRISETSMLALLRKFLRAPVAEINGTGKTCIIRTGKGTPQGGVISPLFVGLYLNDFSMLINTKTRVVDSRKQLADFEFLGFNFKRVPCHWKKGRWSLKVQPSKKSQKKFKGKLRNIVKHRTSKTLEQLIAEVNPIIEGWKNYFVR